MRAWWWRGGPHDEVAEAYADGTPRRLPRKTPLASLRWVVIDAETTGFETTRDRLLSFAVVEIDGDRIRLERTRSWLVYQPRAEINPAVLVHGILPSETAHGVPEAEVLRAAMPVLQGAVLVGHHVGFDARMLHAALQRHWRIGLRNTFVDTAELAMAGLEAFARTGYANQRPPSLEEVCAQCGLEMWERHTAVGDAFTTAQLFLLLCARLRQRLGRELRLGDLPRRRV